MSIAWWQAVLIALGYYLSQAPWIPGAFFTIYRPLIAGTLVGLILGDPLQGMMIGATINLVYLGFISAGGSLPTDPALAGWVGTALGLAAGLDANQTLALAVPLGLVGTLAFLLRMTGDSYFVHRADAAAQEGSIRGLILNHIAYAQLFLFIITFVPAYLAVALGAQPVSHAMSALPAWVMGGLGVVGGLLPAIGIGIILVSIGRRYLLGFVLLGFALSVYFKLDTLAVTIIGVGIVAAWWVVRFGRDQTGPAVVDSNGDIHAGAGVENPQQLLRRRDLLGSWILWEFFCQSDYSWERLQAPGFNVSMSPIVARLYKDDPQERAKALTRHQMFYNTEPQWGAAINGVVASMEEEQARSGALADDSFTAIKTGLMGPLAGIGDTIDQGIVMPVVLSLGISLALSGSFAGPVLSWLIAWAFIFTVSYVMYMGGYRYGGAFIQGVVGSGLIEKVTEAAAVLGYLVLGSLSASFVHLSLDKAVFQIGQGTFNLQKDLLDHIMPSFLALVVVGLTYWLLGKRVNANWIILGMLAFAFIGSFVGIF